ncbi:hypothetical protein BVG81_007700 [Haliangium sp. UPWRP_2]|nr:hypothetical protein BVG81_007700 [Haliangium sp. UPWRP_2]
MEFLDGETLRARLRREPPLAAADVLSIGGQLAAAMAAAHAQGVIHRDLKPENVMLAPDGQRVKILDFGIARAASFANQLTSDGRRLGTPAYMAPEQCAGERAMASADGSLTTPGGGARSNGAQGSVDSGASIASPSDLSGLGRK